MSRVPSVALVLVLVLGVSPAAQPQEKRDATAARRGAATFQTYCAPCHGTSARGDGPMADSLRFAPADLTAIARKSGGRFPADKVAKIIDGRENVKGHGGTDMPIWGDAFKNTREGVDERRVKAIIGDLVQHLATLQAPAEK
jgi:mono/diheme cytochrome c family protein